MRRISTIATCLVLSALAGCGEKKVEVVPGTEKHVDAAKPAIPSEPAAAWSSKDAKGFDWAGQMGAVKFDTDWKRAMASGKKSAKPVVLLFTEKKNADAAKMAAVLKDPRVTAALGEFVPGLVDNEANGPLAERYGVRAVPMLVFTSAAGEAIGSSVGVTNADEVLGDIKGALATMKEDADEGK